MPSARLRHRCARRGECQRGGIEDLSLRGRRLQRRPPAMSTRPSRSRVAVWYTRGSPIGVTLMHVSVNGSYTSAEDVAVKSGARLEKPPTSKTRPSLSNVAVWANLGADMVH